MTLWRYTNLFILFIIIIIMAFARYCCQAFKIWWVIQQRSRKATVGHLQDVIVCLMMTSREIYQRVCQWTNGENRLAVGEIIKNKDMVSRFFWLTVYRMRLISILYGFLAINGNTEDGRYTLERPVLHQEIWQIFDFQDGVCPSYWKFEIEIFNSRASYR